MVNMAIPDHHPILIPENNLGQFYSQGTVFFVMNPEDVGEGIVPQIQMNVFFNGVSRPFILFPQTPNGDSPVLDFNIAPATFWMQFKQDANTFFNEYFGAVVQMNIGNITRWWRDKVVTTNGIVFSQNQG